MPPSSKSKKPQLHSRRPYSAYHVFYRLDRMYLLQTVGPPDDEIRASFAAPGHYDPFEHPRPEKYANVKMPPYWYSCFRAKEKRKHIKKSGRIDMKTLSKKISENWRNVDSYTKAYCMMLSKTDAHLLKAEATDGKKTGNASSNHGNKVVRLSKDGAGNSFEARDGITFMSSKQSIVERIPIQNSNNDNNISADYVGSLLDDVVGNKFEVRDRASYDAKKHRYVRHLPIQNNTTTNCVNYAQGLIDDPVPLDSLNHDYYTDNEGYEPIDPAMASDNYIIPAMKKEDAVQLLGSLWDYDHEALSETSRPRTPYSSFRNSMMAPTATTTSSFNLHCHSCTGGSDNISGVLLDQRRHLKKKDSNNFSLEDLDLRRRRYQYPQESSYSHQTRSRTSEFPSTRNLRGNDSTSAHAQCDFPHVTSHFDFY